jgi:hypothetical protein
VTPIYMLMPAPMSYSGRNTDAAVAMPCEPPIARPASAHRPSTANPIARTMIVCISGRVR